MKHEELPNILRSLAGVAVASPRAVPRGVAVAAGPGPVPASAPAPAPPPKGVLLPSETIHEIHDAAIAVGLGRQALLAGFSRQFVDSLPVTSKLGNSSSAISRAEPDPAPGGRDGALATWASVALHLQGLRASCGLRARTEDPPAPLTARRLRDLDEADARARLATGRAAPRRARAGSPRGSTSAKGTGSRRRTTSSRSVATLDLDWDSHTVLGFQRIGLHRAVLLHDGPLTSTCPLDAAERPKFTDQEARPRGSPAPEGTEAARSRARRGYLLSLSFLAFSAASLSFSAMRRAIRSFTLP